MEGLKPRRRIDVLCGVLLALMLSACTSVVADHREQKGVLTITGRIDDGFSVRFAVSYTPVKETKGLCTEFEPLAGFWVVRDRKFYYDAVSTNGTYTLDVPLSAMPPGECEWRAGMISYAISDTHQFSTYLSMVAIDKPNRQATGLEQPATTITYSCRKAVPFCSGGNPARGVRVITKDQETLEVNFLADSTAH